MGGSRFVRSAATGGVEFADSGRVSDGDRLGRRLGETDAAVQATKRPGCPPVEASQQRHRRRHQQHPDQGRVDQHGERQPETDLLDRRDWDRERTGWHLLVDQQPAAVVHVEDADDVVAAVRYAAANGLAVTAQPGGHGATVAVNGTILLRTGALNAIETDLQARTARVGAGVRWGELNAALSGTGLSGVPGSTGDTTVVGYLLGGGLGWFGRKYGIASNHVRAVELVTADGRIVTVTRESDPELFWALRGGGGEFGIVLAMTLDLVDVTDVYGGRVLWPVEQAKEVLTAFAGITRTAPVELTLWAWLLNMPDVPFVPEPLRGRWAVAVDVCHLGTADGAEKLLAPLRALPGPDADTLAPMTLDQLDSIAAEPVDPVPGMLETRLLTGLGEDTIDTLLAAVRPGSPSPLLAHEIRHLGGAFAEPLPTDGAAGHLSEPYLLLYGGMVPVPELAEVVAGANQAVRSAMAPYSSDRVPANFAGDERPDASYPTEVLDRLRSLKKERDPRGVIRGNRPLV